jgi:outer membrane receptor protein involved in Fe transport
VVTAGRDVTRRLPLPDKAIQGEAVRITGTAGKASEAGMLFAQKNAPSVSDGISSEQISKSPDGDAAAALKRVTGISVGGDGLVYVRGLGERYVNMQLNGMTVSSPNPEKRVIPLDMFPTRLLENLVVSKTFTADQPAEFAGGSLQLRTKDYPDKRLIEFSAGAGYEPGVTFDNFMTYKGGALDWLGLDDGTRAVPGNVPRERFDHRSPNMGDTPEERQATQQAILSSLKNVWTPYETTSPLNQSYGLSLGNKIPLGDDRIFGWLLGGTYAAKNSVDEEFTARVSLDQFGKTVYRDRVTRDIFTESVQWGVLGTATFKDGDRHKLRLNVMANNDWEDEVTRVVGQRESDGDTSLLYELINTRQMLYNAQLEGEHRLPEGMKLSWMGAVTGASRVEPDRRMSKYFLMRPEHPEYNPDFPWFVAATLGLQDRYWFDLQETGWGGKVDLEAPVEWGFFREGSKARTGLFAFSKSREFDVRRLSYNSGGALSSSPIVFGNTYEEYFGLFNGAADSGYISNTSQFVKDNYTVEDFQWAAHVQGDLVLNDAWRAIVGLRLVGARVEGLSKPPQGELSPDEAAVARCNSSAQCEIAFGYDQMALLPALSLVYGLSEAQNVRASWTRTFSYPEYREMSPMLFFSYLEALETVGNVNLKPTDIQNYDLRWEWFPSASEMLAVSGFYKMFENPVETRMGAEWEVRAGLERFHDLLLPFSVVGNYTWIYSEVEGERKRAMQGQSPYLVNAILFYEPPSGKTQMSLLYNKFGRRISKVGVDNFPDVYEEARESLEYSWSQTLAKGLKAKFTARNLTSAASVQTQGGLLLKRVENSPSFSLGVTYAL